jgi:type IV pilus assembly protein PilA
MTIKCPKCGSPVDVTGLQPGAAVSCTCGNVLMVPKKGMSRTVLFIIIGAAFVFLCCPGVLAAIAIPNFIRFQSRAKQAECNANLRSFYVAARVAQEEGNAQKDLLKMGFSPERGNRYAYILGPGPMEDRSGPQAAGTQGAEAIGVDTFKNVKDRPLTFKDLPPDVASQVGISGVCPDCSLTMACVGNVDRDASDSPDVWSISTQDRHTANGETIPAGEVYNHVNDVTSN